MSEKFNLSEFMFIIDKDVSARQLRGERVLPEDDRGGGSEDNNERS